MSNKKFQLWLNQAENDLLWGKSSFAEGFFSQTCFISQQVGEKCLKAYAYFQGAEIIKGHSLVLIARDLNINGKIKEASEKLDLYYITARYPDSLPVNIEPSKYFSKEQAAESLQQAESILVKIKEMINE